MDHSSLWHFLAHRDLHLDKGQCLTLRIKLLMAELKSLGIASRVRKPSNLSYWLPALKVQRTSTPTAPSPFITINNEEVIFYISPNADTDTVELIIKGKMSTWWPSNFLDLVEGNEKQRKAGRKRKDGRRHCQHREWRKISLIWMLLYYQTCSRHATSEIDCVC